MDFVRSIFLFTVPKSTVLELSAHYDGYRLMAAASAKWTDLCAWGLT
jgi:hypothetical protein